MQLKYAEIRDLIKSGDLLAWSHERWGSFYDLKIQLVRMFTRSEYCHVGIAYVMNEKVWVLEAVSTGVRIFPLSRLTPFWWVALDVRWSDEAERWALKQIGEPYSTWQAILAGLGLLNPGEDSIWQCAEFAADLSRRCFVELGTDVTPTAVMRAAQRLPGRQTIFVEEIPA